MTDPNYTHMAFLLDASGSMATIKSDIEGGFNAFITDQRTQPGRCTVTLADFSSPGDYVVRYAAKDLSQVPPLSLEPRGMTALLDSIGRLISETGQFLAGLPEDQRPGLVMVGIMTDGHENSSREWKHQAIKELIERQEQTYQWVFNYLGANQDAIEVGATLGVRADSALTYAPDAAGSAMAAYSTSMSSLRGAVAAGASVGSARKRAAYTDKQRREAAER
ncbi:VWA domain-containing protein [Ornithinimicrobium cryptoxanthini]|uniref:VWA domain-containing protein n=1 Tax=Ornithinimicrobium cryptoxanthini TaxID=2934161 RepID=A0ABY4YG07_9MICO|nr:VWA domain-containing protein [Ornithinimicrobium cryptoxanthini]USQ75668.1 VWA domain-containing protein [Ornithinimicrobium cryptoxanthini]